MQTFLVLGATFGFIGIALGAFGSDALRSKLTSERVATFETVFGAVTPFGGTCLLLGWAVLLFATLVK